MTVEGARWPKGKEYCDINSDGAMPLVIIVFDLSS